MKLKAYFVEPDYQESSQCFFAESPGQAKVKTGKKAG